MTISYNDDTRLYLKRWNYNVARIMTELAQLVISKGGRVKRQKSAIVSDRNMPDSIIPIKVTHISYIQFVVDDVYYMYSINDNPFFDFLIVKTPVIKGKYARNLYAQECNKKWMHTLFAKNNWEDKDIVTAAQAIYHQLMSMPISKNFLETKTIQVLNTYNDNYHKEVVAEKPEYEIIDF